MNQNTHFKPENIFFVKIERGILGFPKGPFNNYVDKMRGEGSKKFCSCPRSGYKSCLHKGGGGGQIWENSVHIVVE